MSKARLRRARRQARAALPPDLVDGWSAAIIARLTTLDEFLDAAVIHCYASSLPGEVRTDPLIARSLSDGKRVICPRVRAHGQLEHREITHSSQLVAAAFGLREPDPDRAPPVDPDLAELIIAPGVAFTLDGARLGMGGGYYDRFLLGRSAARVGLAYEMQLTGHLPQSAHDQSVDLIVTELRVIRCR